MQANEIWDSTLAGWTAFESAFDALPENERMPCLQAYQDENQVQQPEWFLKLRHIFATGVHEVIREINECHEGPPVGDQVGSLGVNASGKECARIELRRSCGAHRDRYHESFVEATLERCPENPHAYSVRIVGDDEVMHEPGVRCLLNLCMAKWGSRLNLNPPAL